MSELLVPTNNSVVVKDVQEQNTTAGGIIIPDAPHKYPPKTGIVVAVGPGKDNGKYPMTVQPGNRIMFSGVAGLKATNEGEEVLIITEDDVWVILED